MFNINTVHAKKQEVARQRNTRGMQSPFTKVPPSVLYVVSGQDARMMWDYNVSNRDAEFGSYSPTWYYINVTQIQIANEYKWSSPKWKWSILPTCPDRLKGRLRKESTATLVISSVTITDSGIYECGLTLTSGLYISSKVELFVTVLIPSPGPLTREVGQDVVFMINSTAMSEATWGVRDGDSNDLNPRLYRVFNPGSAFPDTKINSTSYAGRVSFVGDLTKGQAWFKITNLNINDTNQYNARIFLQGESSYRFSSTRLNVIQQVAPATTIPLQTSTRELSTSALSSKISPRPTSQVPQISNRSISIKVVKEVSGNLSDANSDAFKTFSENFLSEINIVYRNFDNFEEAKVTRVSENIIPVKFVVFFKNTIKPDEICAPLKDEVKDNKLGSLKIVPGSLGCSNEPSFPKNQSSSACTCTSIIAACTTIIIFLILVVVVLLFYIWRGRSNTGKGAESRGSSNIQDKDLESYENVHQVEDTSQRTTTKTARTRNEKEIYETIKENRNKDTAATKANVKSTRGPSVDAQGDVPPLPQHYQDLQIKATHPTPLYEPLKQRGDFGSKGELTPEDPKTYEHLQQSASGKEYQSLKRYKDSESKV
ncbi:uncharacterized protein LOC116300126 isoform X3 [Actinia tenebrosa]|uniref:Uncharacterized protein LOC116300126 isoform X3 n=1 Tax=Actinia tenebrosa TaxID=6105 RepID=A0A6P8I882_ACTTE|nr:uncharacterized protein LOC116300126 isoform X3 [Actinia tenebrosa]